MSSDPTLKDVLAAVAELREELRARPSRWMSVGEMARETGLGVRTIRAMLAAGRLTAYRPARGRVLLDRAEVEAYIRGTTARPRRGRGTAREGARCT